MSDDLVTELRDVLSRDKFSKLRDAIGKTAEEIVSDLVNLTELVPSAEISQDAVRDPKDRIVLTCAVGGQTDYIVSGDQDLLVLSSFQGIVIINATHFLQVLADQSS